jgi:serine/threonine protein kinase
MKATCAPLANRLFRPIARQWGAAPEPRKGGPWIAFHRAERQSGGSTRHCHELGYTLPRSPSNLLRQAHSLHVMTEIGSQAQPKRIAGYRLRLRLGGGGMGVVFLAEDRKGRKVALKIIRAELADDPAFRRRFRREVDAASRVAGVCTARVLDADPEGQPPYLVTEYVPGPTLDAYVRQHGPLDLTQLSVFALGFAEALVAIHSSGLVHRDLKPSNIILSAEGPRVIDFGIARAQDATAITQTGITPGTPAWMAPEQAKGAEATPASDIFAWGALVAFAGTGQAPFGAGAPDAVIYRIVHEAPDLAGLSGTVQTLVARALSKEPSPRPSAPQVVDALLDGQGEQVSGGATEDAVTLVLSETWRLEPLQSQPAVIPRPRWRIPLLALASVCLAVLAGWAISDWLLRAGDPVNSQPQSSGTLGSPIVEPTSSASPTGVETASPTSPSFNPVQILQKGIRTLRELGYEPVNPRVGHVTRHLWALQGSNAEATIGGGTNYDHRIFFFYGRRYLGTDTAEPSAQPPSIVSRNPFTVAVEYFLYTPNDPFCCPSAGFAIVRFSWDGNRLVPLDPIPANRSPNLAGE